MNSSYTPLPPINAALLLRRSDQQGISFGGLCVIFASTFNMVLCFLDTHLLQISSVAVILSELGLLICISSVIINIRAESDWFYLMFWLVLSWLIFSAIRSELNPKLLRDVLLIPIFVLLGKSQSSISISRLLLIIQCLVFSVMLFELISPAVFSRVFNIMQYYIHTRGFSEDSFWNESSDLFVSATRSGDRFFPFFGAHRLSSIFLEPVSLGNYVIIVTVILVSFREIIASKTLFVVGLMNVTLLFASDGRLAFGVCVAIVVTTPVLTKLPIRPVWIFPVIFVAGTFMAVRHTGEDNLSGRLGYTVDLISQLDVQDIFGFRLDYLPYSYDSGLVYFIISQSVFGMIILLLFLFNRPATSKYSSRYSVGCAIYLSSTMMVSYSLFSIKTAALLWFAFGLSQRKSAFECIRSSRVDNAAA